MSGDVEGRAGGSGRADEFVTVANVAVGGCGTVYTTTQSTTLAAVTFGGLILLWFVLPVRRRERDR